MNPSAKQLLVCVLLIAPFFGACSDKDEIKYGEQIIGLGSPIALGYDSTVVILQDYFMNPEGLDSVSISSGLKTDWSTDKQKLTITGRLLPKLGILFFLG